jgi:hypothetical protein
LDKQRNELKTEFDSIIRKREHEWRLQADEFNTITLAKDLEVILLKYSKYICKFDKDNNLIILKRLKC